MSNSFVMPRRKDRSAEQEYARRCRAFDVKHGFDGPRIRTDQIGQRDTLVETYRRLEREGGPAPGPDGLTSADFSPTESAYLMSILARTMRDGGYRPGARREVPIPKSGGGTRTLRIPSLFDRVVGKAV